MRQVICMFQHSDRAPQSILYGGLRNRPLRIYHLETARRRPAHSCEPAILDGGRGDRADGRRRNLGVHPLRPLRGEWRADARADFSRTPGVFIPWGPLRICAESHGQGWID
jgi:hypothetical protein